MSHAIIYNRARNTLTPGSNLTISPGSDGLFTATMDFQCIKGDLASPAIQFKLAKGNSIASLYPDIDPRFDFLYVDNYDARDQPGGYTIVEVTFKGVELGDDTQFDDEKSIVYTRNNSLSSQSILNNPNFKAEVPNSFSRETIRLCMIGQCNAPFKDDPYRIAYSGSDQRDREDIGIINDNEKTIQWYEHIVIDGNHTYLAPTSEWTKSATAKGKLRDQDLANFGYIDTPDGDPTAPDGHVWIHTGATESIIKQGEGANSYSITWMSGNSDMFPDLVYTKPTS